MKALVTLVLLLLSVSFGANPVEERISNFSFGDNDEKKNAEKYAKAFSAAIFDSKILTAFFLHVLIAFILGLFIGMFIMRFMRIS